MCNSAAQSYEEPHDRHQMDVQIKDEQGVKLEESSKDMDGKLHCISIIC